jgi:hypothetical protein
MKIKIIIAIISVLGIGCAPVKTTITINESRIFDDLNYKDYQSSIDSNFNYAEDIIEFFPNPQDSNSSL